MFKFVKTEETEVEYLKQLVVELRKAQKKAAKVLGNDGVITVRLIHTCTTSSSTPSAHGILRWNKGCRGNKGLVATNSYTEQLVMGENYTYTPINNLVEAAVRDVNNTIDMFAMNCEEIFKEDIIGQVERFIMDNLRVHGIEEGYNVSVDANRGAVNRVTITVA